MTVGIATRVSGFLFLSILATLAASVAFGNMVEVKDSHSFGGLGVILFRVIIGGWLFFFSQTS